MNSTYPKSENDIWVFIVVNYSDIPSYEDRMRVRRQYNNQKHEIRASFRAAAYQQMHHIVPLGLGGTNDLFNLTNLYPRPHRDVHLFIDKQIAIGLEIIEIPLCLSWNFKEGALQKLYEKYRCMLAPRLRL